MSYIKQLQNGLVTLLQDKDVFLIGEDITEPYGGSFKVSKGLSLEFPHQVIATPMSEQGFTGMGIGMALAGLKVIVEIMFGDFITLCADQMINHASKFVGLYNKKLHFVLRTPMGGYRGYGGTHSQSLEKLLMGFPNIWVISPSILHNPGNLLIKSLNLGEPILFVENKLDYTRNMLEETKSAKDHYIELFNSEFPLIKVTMRDEPESDYVIVTYGGLVAEAISLQEELYLEDEISVHIVSPSQLFPLDNNLIDQISDYKHIILLEESYTGASWTSEIASTLVEKQGHCCIHRFSAQLKTIAASENLETSILPNIKDVSDLIKRIGNE